MRDIIIQIVYYSNMKLNLFNTKIRLKNNILQFNCNKWSSSRFGYEIISYFKMHRPIIYDISFSLIFYKMDITQDERRLKHIWGHLTPKGYTLPHRWDKLPTFGKKFRASLFLNRQQLPFQTYQCKVCWVKNQLFQSYLNSIECTLPCSTLYPKLFIYLQFMQMKIYL